MNIQETPQNGIGRKVKLDLGNLSRSITKGVDAGVVIRVAPDQPLDAKSAKKSDWRNG